MVSKSRLAELQAVIVESQLCDVTFTIEKGKIIASEGKPVLEESHTDIYVGKKRLPLDEVEQVGEWQRYLLTAPTAQSQGASCHHDGPEPEASETNRPSG